jgi:N-acetyl-beta-hexosaminidase
MLAGRVIAYKSKYQATIAILSTKAEFTAASKAILHKLGFSQYLPTVMFKDNSGALHMANAQQPTSCTQHMNTKDWLEHDQLELAQLGTAKTISVTRSPRL